jgi:hypothetical protein
MIVKTMREVKNLKEAKELADTYLKLSKETGLHKSGRLYLDQVTGFGSGLTCTLCVAVGCRCGYCIWGPDGVACRNVNYNKIVNNDMYIPDIKHLLKTRAKMLNKRIEAYERSKEPSGS